MAYELDDEDVSIMVMPERWFTPQDHFEIFDVEDCRLYPDHISTQKARKAERDRQMRGAKRRKL